jgi:transcriptional regulator with XRE-family HTH domain
VFYDNFKALCDKKGIAPSVVVRSLGLSTGNIAGWKKGQTPKYERLVAIADYFGVSISELTGEALDGGEPMPEKPGERSELTEYLDQLRERPEMRMLFSVAKDASKEDVEAVARFIESLRKS